MMSLLECLLFHQIRFRDHRMVNHLVGGYNGDMEIVLNDLTQTNPYPDCLEDFEKIFANACKETGRNTDLVCSVIFTTPEQIHEINRTYRKIDRPTDVISFALQDDPSNILIEEEEQELGDIFINIQAVRDQAEEYGHSQRRELDFLFCHGLLHLMGYDHMEPEDEKEMFHLQDVILDEVVTR